MTGDIHVPWDGIGVGVVYNGALSDRLFAFPEMVDAVSVVPETLWHEAADRSHHEWIGAQVAQLEASVGALPKVFHGIGLSLGSGLPLDVGHLDQIGHAAERYRPYWYSEHLAAFRVGQALHAQALHAQAHAGVGLPVPFDRATLRDLVPKVADVVARAGLPLLLENSAIYVEVPGEEMSEAAFLNRLGAETGAGVLLDLHNLYCNEVNLGWDAEAYLAELDLEKVLEVHVAGGEMLGRWYTDAHSGPCPDRVWQLLDMVVDAAPALRLVTLELHGSRVESLGWDGLDDQLARIRAHTHQEISHVACDGFYGGLAAMVGDPDLVTSVRHGDSSWLEALDLTPEERGRLVGMAGADGMEVLCGLYRANRLTALIRTVPTVVEALGAGRRDEVTAFWRRAPRTDMQFRNEADAFCHFVTRRHPADTALLAVVAAAEVVLAERYEAEKEALPVALELRAPA